MNQTIDKIIFPYLFNGTFEDGQRELGIYGACFKIAVVMVMFTQAFRFAYEPFIFAKNKGHDNKNVYAEVMKYFIIFSLFIFLAVMFYIDIVKHFVAPNYYEGIGVVPIVMIGMLFFGIYFNLSLWYKLTDDTRWGAYFSIVGLVIMVVIMVIFVPVYGYIACAWAAFFCNFAMMILSYFSGQKYYPINYGLKSIGMYFLLFAVLYAAGMYVPIQNEIPRLLFRTLLAGIFILYTIKKDIPLSEIPYLKKIIRP
jgi:O-antigen/teichoic acid export membrane protein